MEALIALALPVQDIGREIPNKTKIGGSRPVCCRGARAQGTRADG